MAEHDLTTLPGRLRWARECKGIKAHVLSKNAGLASGHVGLIESGEIVQPQGDTLMRLADQLGISLDWLMRGKGEAPAADQPEATGVRTTPGALAETQDDPERVAG